MLTEAMDLKNGVLFQWPRRMAGFFAVYQGFGLSHEI
jgi:hypothetical protein